MTKKVSDAQIKAALRNHRGILAPAARELGIERSALAQRCDNNQELRNFREDLDQEILDRSEEVIFDGIDVQKDLVTARWLQERKGRDRGYGNSVQATLDEKQIEAFVFAFGGDANKLRALRDTLNPEKPGKPK